ncbi:hypothetical protein [Streptomyces avicenniae]|uniref:hypothetical protein n=1 Tax=Streptomyces avicenniae TaxID=500153 RepID=UPI003B831901
MTSRLARRPYDLRHAGISFWLSSGVAPAECARRAGHSLALLFHVYAKVLAQNEERSNRRIETATREWDDPIQDRPTPGILGDTDWAAAGHPRNRVRRK